MFKIGDKVRVIGVGSEGDFEVGTIGEVKVVHEKFCVVIHDTWVCGINNEYLEFIIGVGREPESTEETVEMEFGQFKTEDIKELNKTLRSEQDNNTIVGSDYTLGSTELKQLYVEKFVNPKLAEYGILDNAEFGKTMKECYGKSIDKFTKFDTEKSRTDLIDPDFLLKLGDILEFGARKYDADNWKKCEDHNRYYAAAMRHLLQWKTGEILDPESGSNHLISASVNLMFLHYLSTHSEK